MVRAEKVRQLEELKKLIQSYMTIAIADLTRMPTKELQQLRHKLADRVLIRMFKKRLIERALEELHKPAVELSGQLAVLCSNLDSFSLYALISSQRIPSFARPGDVAEKPIVVPAGPTELMPGPVIAELSRIGIPVGVEEGKVVIKKEVVVAKPGDRINAELASALAKLGIHTTEIGLNVLACLEKDKVYGKDVLELVDSYPIMLNQAVQRALKLSAGIAHPCSLSIPWLVRKACLQAGQLARILSKS